MQMKMGRLQMVISPLQALTQAGVGEISAVAQAPWDLFLSIDDGAPLYIDMKYRENCYTSPSGFSQFGYMSPVFKQMLSRLGS